MFSRTPPPRQIYTDLLLCKDLGYPLYYPEPCRNAVRRGWSGVSIGDVGIINNQGGFDFKFNVIERPTCEPDIIPGAYRDVGETVSVANGLPLHVGLSFLNGPPQFQPIVLEEGDIRYYENDCHPGKVIGRYIKHTLSVNGEILPHIPPIRAGLIFNIECSREKAASLILPDGATRMEVLDEQLEQFYNLALRHGASWLGLFPFTGTSLCLVTGCVKASSWALMSLYGSSKTGGLSLKFGVAPGAGPSSTWLETGPADTRHSTDTDDNNRNQCVFLRGIRISKRDPKWSFRRNGEQVHLDVLDTGENLPFNPGGTGNSASGSTTRTHLAPASGGSSSSNSGGQQGAGQTAFRNLSQNVDGGNTDLSAEDQNLDDDIVVEPLTEVPVSIHPSEIINQRLLHENPSAEFAMTHDDQWAKLLSEIDMPLDEETLWLRMLEKHDINVESNCVFFVEKVVVRGRDLELSSSCTITQFDNLPILSNLDYIHAFVNRPINLLWVNVKHRFSSLFGLLLPDANLGISNTAEEVIIIKANLLPCGSRDKPLELRYSFFQPANNIIQRNRELKVMTVIKHIEEQVPGVKFHRVYNDSDAIIRIAFNHEHPEGKLWSRVGREADRVNSDEPTMNLSDVAGHESDEIKEGSREYGDIMRLLFHALGMFHQHQHPGRNFSISAAAVAKDLDPDEWSKSDIYDNIVRRLQPNGIDPYPPPDNESCTNYHIHREWTSDGSEVKRNNRPSDLDWAWLNLIYPPRDPIKFERALSKSMNSRISKENRASILKLYLEGKWDMVRSEIARFYNPKSNLKTSKKGVFW